jgi:Holliday junction resolvase
MSGKRHRQKGTRRELEIVHLHRELGADALRVPLSGAAEGHPGDVLIKLQGDTLRGEVKARKSGEGFVTLERWLGANDFLFLKRDRAEPVVVLPWPTYERLIRAALALDGLVKLSEQPTANEAPLDGAA